MQVTIRCGLKKASNAGRESQTVWQLAPPAVAPFAFLAPQKDGATPLIGAKTTFSL
jgi:hypothetical protein